jgi:hypothetical protein
MANDDAGAPAQDAETLWKEIRAFFSNGEFFRSFDLAIVAYATYPNDVRFAHRAVLSLANSGATALALEKFRELGLDTSDDREIRSLLGRLRKDEAFAATGHRRLELLKESQSIYEAAFRRAEARGDPEAYYPAINAATMALLAGEKTKARSLAGEVLELLRDRVDNAPDSDRYWVLATMIEAHLLRGDDEAAKMLIPQATAASGDDYVQLASTGRQLKRIIDVGGRDSDILGLFAPATVVHYTGHIISAPGRPGRFTAAEEARVAAEIDRVLDGMRVGVAYGALAAGSDILFAEALLKRGIALNVVLPFNKDEFIDSSVRTAGDNWVARFEACLAAAKTVRFATEDAYLSDDHLFTYASQLAMGLATLCARHLHAPQLQLVVWDGDARARGVAGTIVDMQAWRNAGHPQQVIRCGSRGDPDDVADFVLPQTKAGRRATRAMLFADIHGFSKLTDAELPIFTRVIMGSIAKVIDGFRGDIGMINTWGDGVFAVFNDVAKAAACALSLQEALSAINLAEVGLPPHLSLRLGGHLGPTYELHDPIIQRTNFYGAHVSRAARIEPVTPLGCVYVTETFAAALEIADPRSFGCDYVGWTDMAKEYGALRMFLLKRRVTDEGPTALFDLSKHAEPADLGDRVSTAAG